MSDTTDQDARGNACGDMRERWRASHESGADACKDIALAFELCPDLFLINAFRDFDSDLVDIEIVWSVDDAAPSTLDAREKAISKLNAAERTLTECQEFGIYAQTKRPEDRPMENLAAIASGLSLPKAQAFLEAIELRASIARQAQTAPGSTPPKPRL